MVLKDEQLTVIQHVHNGKNVFVWLHTARLNFLWGLTVCIVLHVHFGKGEAVVYRHPQASKPWPCMMLELYTYSTEHLSVIFQLTYLDELYGECNRTACANSGYQAFFSPITKRLGMKPWRMRLITCDYTVYTCSKQDTFKQKCLFTCGVP